MMLAGWSKPNESAWAAWLGTLCLLGSILGASATTNLSFWAFPGTGGRIIRQPDPLGNRVLDYSGVGYKGGTVPIPTVVVMTNLSPIAGVDNGPRIQAAINYVASLPLVNGFRGAVFLNAGEYAISNSITISASGVVLRGAGDGTNGTILRAAGPRPAASVSSDHAPLIIISGSGSLATSGIARNITNNYVPVGALSFCVNSTSGLAVGSRVMISRPSPANWIHDIGMDLVSPAWTAGSFNVPNERFITRIEGNRIMLDAPLTCALEIQYGGSNIQNCAWAGRINNVGIEDIRGVSDFDPSVTSTTGASSPYYADELHALDFIQTAAVENAWLRRVTSQFFGYACAHLAAGTRAMTVSDCNSLDPVSIITGERRYAFGLADAQFCLVQNCYTRADRHQFVTDSLDAGPNVFVDGLSDNAFADAGPHFRWGTGTIWDNVTVNGNQINVRNRGNAGTSHGWAGANEVVWNSKADGFIVESPATARNWLIGSIGPLAVNSMAVGPHPDGTYDSLGTNVFPNSLYCAQLQDRLAAPSLQTREYWLGEIDAFTNSLPGGERVYLDSAWSNSVKSVANGQPLDGFDVVTNNHWISFTFSFSLGLTDRVVAATLSLAMRATASAASNTLYLGALTNGFGFTNLGWQSIGIGTNTTVRVLDLASQLSLLTNGRLNVAASGDLGLDWAMLEIQVAPVQTLVTSSIPPAADAFVRGGVNAGINYGTNATLDLKLDSAASNSRQAYLRWNLAGYSSRLQHARIRLTPVSVGTNGLEHGVALAAGSGWSESAINWNNQPGGGKRFATWIPDVNLPAEFVVTPHVQAALSDDGQLSLELFPLNNAGGPGLVSYASSRDPNPANRPQLLLVYSNALPSLSSIADLAIPANTNTGALPFTIGDPVSPPDLLAVGALSSNTNLVSTAGIRFGGSLSNRTVTLTPSIGQFGTTLITLIVTNPAGLTAGSQFSLTVTNGGGISSASGAWAVDASGEWNNPANWIGGIIATGVDMTATFSLDVAGNRYLNNDSPRPLGNLVFGDANSGTAGAWFITNNAITLQVSNGNPTISVSNVTATVTSLLDGTQGLTLQGGGTLVLGGPNTYDGPTTIIGGALRAANYSALGTASSPTSIGNDPTARLELIGGICLAEPLTVACKGSASGNVPAVLNVSGTNTLSGTLSLTTGGSFWTFEAAGGKLRVTGNPTNITTTNVRTIWLRGAAEGDWLSAIGDSAGALATGVRKDDVGAWALSGSNAYTGNTIVSNGTLRVNGVVRGGVVSVYAGALGGTGLILAPVTIYPGASLAPGQALGALTISNALTLSAGSAAVIEINAQSLTSDLVRGLSSVVYAGTLYVTNLAGTLSGGQSFQLFSAAGSSGNFSGIVPASPGTNLAWNFSPASGTLFVTSTVITPPQFTHCALAGDGNLTLSGTGPAGSGYRIFAATNLVLPLGNWTAVSTGSFGGGVFTFTDLQATNYPRRYYRVVTP